MDCEACRYSEYDEEYDEILCTIPWAEDVAARYTAGHYTVCPYFFPGGDYDVVRKQN